MHKNKQLDDIRFTLGGRQYTVDKNLMNFFGGYRDAKEAMVRRFINHAGVKENLGEFTIQILPILFGPEQARQIEDAVDQDYEALFYKLSPWAHYNVMPIIKHEIRARKRNYARYLRW